MNHYDALLAELRTIDKRMLRKLDHKRRPPEPMPVEIWYGPEITRDLLDKVLDYGGYSEIEGTPLVLCRYTYFSDPFRTYLFTTVGVYTTQMDLEYSNHRFRYEKIECPLRYDEFREAAYVKEHGFIMDDVAVTKQDGAADMIAIRHGHVYFSTAFMRCVDYVNRHGPIEQNPPRIVSSDQENLEAVLAALCPGKVTPVFEPRTTITPDPLPAPVEEQKPKPRGSGIYPKAAHAKMEEFRRWAKKSEPEKALRCLKEAADLGHGDACWILGALLPTDEITAATGLYQKACDLGSQEGANALETTHLTVAVAALLHYDDLNVWMSASKQALEMDSAKAAGYLGIAFLTGAEGLDPNPELGFRLLEIAADRGSIQAMAMLGSKYLDIATPESLRKARHYLTMAAQNGDVTSMSYLMNSRLCDTKEGWESARYWGRQAFTAVTADRDRRLFALQLMKLAASEPEYVLWRSVFQTDKADRPQE